MSILTSNIDFLWACFSTAGIPPSEEKVTELRDAKAAQNAFGVTSFLGLTQYSAKFISHFADISEPMLKVTRKKFVWHEAHE